MFLDRYNYRVEKVIPKKGEDKTDLSASKVNCKYKYLYLDLVQTKTTCNYQQQMNDLISEFGFTNFSGIVSHRFSNEEVQSCFQAPLFIYVGPISRKVLMELQNSNIKGSIAIFVQTSNSEIEGECDISIAASLMGAKTVILGTADDPFDLVRQLLAGNMEKGIGKVVNDICCSDNAISLETYGLNSRFMLLKQ